jgi:6-phosphogluconolactonase (cycloisomerase 2 family)
VGGPDAPVFFTCGAAGAAAGVSVTRSFTVPEDQYILVALSTIGVWFEPGIDPPDFCTNGAPAIVDATTSLSFSLDGVPISQVDLFANHREPSSLNQTAVVVPGNPYAAPGSYPGSCSDGYFVMIEPLPPGPHVIECGFTHSNGAVLDHTNEFSILEPILTFVEAEFDGVGGVTELNNPEDPVLSPDGAHLYVPATIDNAVNAFARDPVTGVLTLVEFEKDGVGGVDGIDGAESTAISPDGAHVYVTGRDDNAVAVFERDSTTGALSFVEAEFDGVGGVDGIWRARGVEVSPDGAHVYVVGSQDDAIAVFDRDPQTGALSFMEFHQDGASGVDGLNGATSIALSPDGAHLYVTGHSDHAIAVFARDPALGTLTFLEVVRNVSGLSQPIAAAVSPDGMHVYVAAGGVVGTVVVFQRNPASGALSFVEFHQDGAGGIEGLEATTDLAISPGGDYIFTGANFSKAVTAFRRDLASGTLTFADLERDGEDGVDGLDGTSSVTVSPDGVHLYATSSRDDAVVLFEIAPAPAPVPSASAGARILLALVVGLAGTATLVRRR